MSNEADARQLAAQIEHELELLLEREHGMAGVKVFFDRANNRMVADRELPAKLLESLFAPAAKRAIVAAVEAEERDRRGD